MSNHYLHALPRLPLIPRFAHLRLHVTREDGHVDALTLENPLQPPGHVPCPRINGEHVHFPATTQARMNFLQQLPLLAYSTLSSRSSVSAITNRSRLPVCGSYSDPYSVPRPKGRSG